MKGKKPCTVTEDSPGCNTVFWFQSDEPDTYCAFIKFYMRSFVYILFYFSLFSGEQQSPFIYYACSNMKQHVALKIFLHSLCIHIYKHIGTFPYGFICVELFSAVRIGLPISTHTTAAAVTVGRSKRPIRRKNP